MHNQSRKKALLATRSRKLFLPVFLLIGVALGAVAGQAAPGNDAQIAVGPQYDSTHVYVGPGDLDAFVKGFIAVFGGQASKPAVTNVLPEPSRTKFEYVSTPHGFLSIFAYETPVPFPFGQERTGYLVTDMEQAVKSAREAGAEVIVEPFQDPIGKDAVIQWPGGVKMQLYWHFKPASNPPLQSIPDNRVYVSRDKADSFIRAFVRFARGTIVSDNKEADAGEIGRPGETYRRIRIVSLFGSMQVLVTDGHLPYPFGHETTGYQVADIPATLDTAKAAGVLILSAPYKTDDRMTAILEFPGGYIAEVHSFVHPSLHSQTQLAPARPSRTLPPVVQIGLRF